MVEPGSGANNYLWANYDNYFWVNEEISSVISVWHIFFRQIKTQYT